MFKKLLLLVLLVSSTATLFAQEKKAKEEKKSALIIYGGPQFSMAAVGSGFNPSCKFTYLAGLGYERNDLFGHFGLFGAIEFSEKGTKDFLFLDGRKDSYSFQYLQLNLGLKYQRSFWGMKGFGEVGPYAAYGLGGSASINSHDLNGNSFDDLSVSDGEIYDDGGAGFKSFDAGFRVAVGVEFYNIQIKGGYQRGLVNIADKRLISNGYKNHGFFVTLGYSIKM